MCACVVCRLHPIFSHHLIDIDIGVITPYRKQVQKINALAHFLKFPKGITVGTVEKFQGQVIPPPSPF